MARDTAPGGASTIGGAVYQMLWCLLRAVKLHVGQLHAPLTGDASDPPLLVLEPTGGGGDIQVIGQEIEVEQLKSRASGGTWSLQAFIVDVLPDLFLAANRGDDVARRYRFVTEGTMGQWLEVYSFFRGLARRSCPHDVISALDADLPLRFRTAVQSGANEQAFFGDSAHTERSLFLRIAEYLKERPAIRALALPDADMHGRLWNVLAAFEFVGDQKLYRIEREIDTLLLAIIDRRENIPEKRRSLAMALMTLASGGNAVIDTSQFLKNHGLGAVPLTDWANTRDRAIREFRSASARHRYDDGFDVRTTLAEDIYDKWKASERCLVITGESGTGKTWTLSAIGENALRDVSPVIWVNATGEGDRDLQTAANRFWLDIRGGSEGPIPLRQVANRLKETIGFVGDCRLRVLFDNVATFAEAETLIGAGLPKRGVHIAVTCPPAVATAIADAFEDEVIVADIRDLNWEELHELLDRRLGFEWTQIPDDVREILRRPLLANIYCNELDECRCQPTSEYELIQAMWRRLSIGHQSAFPLDAHKLERLALSVVGGAPYPWSPHQMLDVGIDNDCVRRLERCGWLVRTDEQCWRVFHDRLFNWAVAEAFASQIRDATSNSREVLSQVAEIARRQEPLHSVFLGYVPLDYLWIISGRSDVEPQFVAESIAVIESTFESTRDVFYRQLLPTLGPRIIAGICQRLRDFQGESWILKALLDAVIAVVGGRVQDIARSLLSESDPRLRRRAMKLLRKAGCPELLSEIWHLHCDAWRDPHPYLDVQESHHVFYDDSFGALKLAAVGQSEWLLRSIDAADLDSVPVHDLGWLVRRQDDDGDTWRRCKKALFDKVSPAHSRVLAANIGRFHDAEEKPWLLARISAASGDFLGPTAFQSLIRVDPQAAADRLGDVDLVQLRMCRAWAFVPLLYRLPAKIEAKLFALMKTMSDSWKVGFLYEDNEDFLSPRQLDLLLDELTTKLEGASDSGDRLNRNAFYQEIEFLAAIHRPVLIDVLQQRRDLAFDHALASLLRRIGPQVNENFRDSLVRAPGLSVLRTVGGDRFTQLVVDFATCANRNGRLEAIEWAAKADGQKAISALEDAARRPETWDHGHAVEQNEALRGLAIHEQWEAFAAGLHRWGMHTSVDFIEARLQPQDHDHHEWLEQVRTLLKADPTPNAVIALACGGTAHDASLVRRVLQSAEASSELAHACIICLGMLCDASDEGVRLVARHLGNERHRRSAVRMLTIAGTPAAWDALFVDLQSRFDHVTALNLINLSSHAAEVVKLAKKELPSHRGMDRWGLLAQMIREIRPTAAKEQLLSDRWLRDAVHRYAVATEGRFWITGSKASCIECLAEFDRDTAFQAAVQALESREGHDRELYPRLLMQIDPHRAATVLMRLLIKEKSPLVRRAIGYSLEMCNLRTSIESYLNSDNPQERAAGCELAGYLSDGNSLRVSLVRALDDCHDDVVHAAQDAIGRLQHVTVCEELLTRIAEARRPADHWLYLDHYVDAVDPYHFDGIRRLVDFSISPLIRQKLGKRLNEKRKTLAEKLKKKQSR